MQKRNQIVSPRFEEYAYKGQDVVHYGVRIPLRLTKEEVLEKLSPKARTRINNVDPDIVFMPVTDAHLPKLREMWFDPEDETFPSELGDHKGLVAYLNVGNVLLGGVLWKPEGNNLFMHQLISSDAGKRLDVPTLLIWESYLMYCHDEWISLDVGVSYNPKRYAFFKQFAVETYPILLKRPELVPLIRLSPMRFLKEYGEKRDLPDKPSVDSDLYRTFFPRASYALFAALKYLGIGRGDNVSVVKTFGSTYLSKCVTNMIDKTGAGCALRGMGDSVKAVVVVHEFGIPVYQDRDLKILQWAQENNVPVIEDCAWRTGKVFDWTKYAVFSMTKVAPTNYGGWLLAPQKLTPEYLWSLGCRDFVKEDMVAMEEPFGFGSEIRKELWLMYDNFVRDDGMTPDLCYDYRGAVLSDKWVPTVYMQKFESDEVTDAIVARLEEFGIQAGRYWGEPIVFLPIHQCMTKREVEYMFAVVRGYFNTCRDYGKTN